jgi:hypothetical protein
LDRKREEYSNTYGTNESATKMKTYFAMWQISKRGSVFPMFSPNVAGAFGFVIDYIGLYFLSLAGVFGWKGSCDI